MTTRRLGLAVWASENPMGQQRYEAEIINRAGAALGSGWSARGVRLASLRTPLPVDIRLPVGLMERFPASRPLMGTWAYRNCDLVHRMDLSLPPFRGPEVLTIHDLAGLHFDDEKGLDLAGMAGQAKRARAVITVSEFSADELRQRLGITNTVVIPNGVDPRFFAAAPMDPASLARHGLRAPFILHTGGCTARKNLAGLAAAFADVHARRPDVSLALVGSPDPRRDALFANLPGAVRLGRVGDEAVRALQAAAAVTVVPSLYEGFGLPALEAMAAGTPVVAAARTSLVEVCGDAALLVEPDGPSLAEGLLTALEGGQAVTALTQRARERARTYTWDASARAHAEVWRSALD